MKNLRGKSELILELAASALLICGVGCGADAAWDQGEYDFDVTQQDIRNGSSPGLQKGIIELAEVGGPGFCTGALIGRKFAITAAHCVADQMSSSTDWVFLDVWYFDPETGRRRITSSPVLYAWYIPTYHGAGDRQDDIAILYYRDGLSRWDGTDDSDILPINGGSVGGSVFDIGLIEHFGRGVSSNAGGGSGILRKRPVTISHADKHFFYDLEGTAAACAGDSGGPYIGTRSGVRVIAGIHSSSERDGLCAEDGGRQWAARTNSRTDWIISTLQGSFGRCRKEAHLTRCW